MLLISKTMKFSIRLDVKTKTASVSPVRRRLTPIMKATLRPSNRVEPTRSAASGFITGTNRTLWSTPSTRSSETAVKYDPMTTRMMFCPVWLSQRSSR